MTGDSQISIYFHIPFCRRKCPYCRFYAILARELRVKDFLRAVKIEWLRIRRFLEGREIVSVYFGGGTPSLLAPEAIYGLISLVMEENLSPLAEITLEMNPEGVSLFLTRELKAAGINRVSVGAQILDDDILAIIGREHRVHDTMEAVYLLKEASIDNISVDFMYDLPTLDEAKWEESLYTACSLPIAHLSLYNLVIEKNTPFYRKRERIKKLMPDEQQSAAMFKAARKICSQYGFKQYEISAFQRGGFYSLHNIGYWTARPFIGLGPSAFSYREGKRFKNCSSLSGYCRALFSGRSPVDFVEELLPEDRLKENLVLNLRLLAGVDMNNYKQISRETGAAIEFLKDAGLLQQKRNILKMSARGVLFYDTIAAELI